MLYRLQSGNYVIMCGEQGMQTIERAWHKAALDYFKSNGGSIDTPQAELTVPDNAAQIVAKARFH